MAAFVLTDTAVYVGAADLTGYSNKVEIAAQREAKDATTFASGGWTESRAGLAKVTANIEGFWDAGSGILPDDRMFGDLGVAGVPLTFAPLGPADGGLAYFTSGVRPEYSFGGKVGDMLAYKSRAVGDQPLVRGAIIHPSTSAKTTTGTGIAQLIGAASASQRIYAALHVLAVSGTATPTLTVTVQSDTAVGFPSATTSISFAAATAIGGQFLSVAGPLSDTYFRVSWTITGTNPSFLFVVAVGLSAP